MRALLHAPLRVEKGVSLTGAASSSRCDRFPGFGDGSACFSFASRDVMPRRRCRNGARHTRCGPSKVLLATVAVFPKKKR